MTVQQSNVQVSFRGQKHTVVVTNGTTLAQLGQLLQTATNADYETIKLVVPGVKGAVVPAANPQVLVKDSGNKAVTSSVDRFSWKLLGVSS